jgi:hypothetical protein
MQATAAPTTCKPGTPLTLPGIATYHGPTGAHFDVQAWQGQGGESYTLSVENGTVQSTQKGGTVY